MTCKENSDYSAVVLKDLSDFDFLEFGMHDLAYIKRLEVDNQVAYVVHAADGRVLSSMEDRASAFAAIFANDLEPVLLH